MSATPAGIEVRALARRFGEREAVAGLDFEVHPGELFGLVGPDGAGKTTTLRMLAGVLRPSAGDALVAGSSIAREPERVKQRIAYMSQRFGLYADLTVAENLAFYADLYRVPARERAARLDRLYAFSRLGPFRDRLAGALSGGMKQKLGLSCALVHTPSVLLLDEPTFGVDPVSRRDLWRIVHEMVAEGVTAVVSTAYLDEAERFDRLALLDHGRVIALDTPDGLIRRLEGELLEVRLPGARAAAAVASGLPGVRRAADFGDRWHLSVDSAARRRDEIVTALAARGYPGAQATAVAPGLEDVFLEHLDRPELAPPTAAASSSAADGGEPASPPPADRAAVEVHELSRRFGDFVAVDAVSFSVSAGEVFGFLGPNGAGKTTTIKMLIGLVAPSAGDGRVAGLDIVAGRDEIRLRVGYMSQQFSLYADLTVDENIVFFGGLYGVPRARLAERRAWVLRMAGLEDAAGRRTGELALGWKQRLALGCAVLHEPSILFLDEPTSGVDPISRRRFWQLIYQLAGGGTTVFVTTHYLEEAESCGRLALMNRGRLIALDSPAGLKRSLREPLLELRVDDPLRALALLDGLPGVARSGLFGRALHVAVEDREAALVDLPARLGAGGVTVTGARAIPPSLEDVFVARVAESGGALEG